MVRFNKVFILYSDLLMIAEMERIDIRFVAPFTNVL